MSRIASVFKDKNHKALIAYITVGYPGIESTLKIVPMLAESGCDIIELGIPFSDPAADGATIQHASFEALENGVNTRECFRIAQELREKTNIPLVFMTYYNLVYSHGLGNFCLDCKTTGIDGMIIPDLPPEEADELDGFAVKMDIDMIYLLAPTSTEPRIKMVADKSRGFIYMVSITGITGARNDLPADLGDFINKTKQLTDKPLCVGFGISNPEQAAQVARYADGVIIGSKLIQLLEKDDAEMTQTRDFIKQTRQALDNLD